MAQFALARPDASTRAIVQFLLQPPAERDQIVQRRLEWMWPAGPDRPVAAGRRILLVGDGSAAIASVDAQGVTTDPEPIDEDVLAGLLTDLVSRTVR